MTNKKEEVIRDAEVIDNTAQEARREKEKAVAAQIEAILVEAGVALQPYLSYSEYGLIPRVRLVDNNQTPNGQGTSEAKAEGVGDEDKPSEPVTA